MLRLYIFVGLLAFTLADQSNDILIHNVWPGGFDTTVRLIPTRDYNGWCARIIFEQSVQKIDVWRAQVINSCNCNSEFLIRNLDNDAFFQNGVVQDMSVVVHISGDRPVHGRAFLTDNCQGCSSSGCPTTGTSTIPTSAYTTTSKQTSQPNINTMKSTQMFQSAVPSMTPIQGRITQVVGYTGGNGNNTPIPQITAFSGQNRTGNTNTYFSYGKGLAPGQTTVVPIVTKSTWTLGKNANTSGYNNVTTSNMQAHGNISTVTPASNTKQHVSTKYDYTEALKLSILFYDAQRSGKLPANNPVPWRGDSAVNDSQNGIDLSGGWYDAGNHMKFNFPMSSSATNLLWGLEKWRDAYNVSGQLDEMYDMIRWPLEYFLKCWRPNQKEYYVQVGEGPTDHHYWVRPEDMNMWRPAYKVDANNPGSDVAGETAASLAVGSLVFKDRDSNFSSKLLDAAKSLYKFARDYRGLYSHSVPEAAIYYGSDNYTDELCESAAWLYKATNNTQYLHDAKSFYVHGIPKALHWGDKHISCQMLLYEITKDQSYKNDVESFVQSNMPGNRTYTPCGLDFIDQWGSLRYAANAAFIALLAAENGIGDDQYKSWAMSQIHYILGDNNKNMSYVIGFGSKYPQHPHHSGSSISHRVLKGALVGGPDKMDNYDDKLDDYQKNAVATDYNAGFQSALAGLVHLANKGQLPVAPPAKC